MLRRNFIQLPFTLSVSGPNIFRSILLRQWVIKLLWKCRSEKCFIAVRISATLYRITFCVCLYIYIYIYIYIDTLSNPPPSTYIYIHIYDLGRREIVNVLTSQFFPLNITHEPCSFLIVYTPSLCLRPFYFSPFFLTLLANLHYSLNCPLSFF
jgi:hypothetical protein